MIEVVWPVPEERYAEVVLHLRENFFPDEPLNKSVGLCQHGEPHAELEDHALTTLADRLSIMALDTTNNKIVGVLLNGTLKEGDSEGALEKIESSKDDKFKVIFRSLYRLNMEMDLFNKLGVDKMLEARILSVDKEYRGQGHAARLMAKCEEVAKSNGFKIIKEDSTGLFSQKILAKLGHETIYEIKYDDLKNDDGEVIFKTPPPHTSLKLMMKVLDDE